MIDVNPVFQYTSPVHDNVDGRSRGINRDGVDYKLSVVCDIVSSLYGIRSAEAGFVERICVKYYCF